MNEIELKRLLEVGKKTIERKVYEIKADEAEMDGNTLKGHPSALGNMDKGNDVMFPGVYSKCLKGFLENGFIAWSHNWDEMIGYPTVAREEGKNLYSEAVFHSTPKAQEARTICMERLNAKKSVGLSVGFMPDYSEGLAFMDDAAKDYKTDAKVIYFASGNALLTFAKSNGYDMALFDTKGIKACEGYCRGILLVDELFEWSPCAIPMNPKATATDAKSLGSDFSLPLNIRDFEKFLREAGYSNSQAKAIASKGFNFAQREVAITDDDPAPVPLHQKYLAGMYRRSQMLREVNQ